MCAWGLPLRSAMCASRLLMRSGGWLEASDAVSNGRSSELES